MTNEVQSYTFQPTSGGDTGFGFDFFNNGAQYVSRRARPGTNTLQFFELGGGVIRGELTIRDLGGDIEQVVTISRGFVPNSVSDSDGDLRFAKTFCQPPGQDGHAAATFGELTNEEDMLSVAYLRNESPDVIVGGGSTADEALYVLDMNGESPRVTAQTYTPGSLITSLTSAVIGGVGEAERIIVGRLSAAAQVLSSFDGSPTVDGTMHANTAECYGIIVTPVNASVAGATTLLLYVNNTIYTLSSSVALGTAPTAVLTNIPAGGFPLGFVQLQGAPARAYWCFPFDDLDGPGLDSLLGRFRIWSTNAEGDDPQVLSLPLAYVTQAKYWPDRGGILSTDQTRLIWSTGAANIDTGWHLSPLRGDSRDVITDILPVKDRCIVVVDRIDAQAGDVVGATFYEEWIPETGRWHRLVELDDSDMSHTFPSTAPTSRFAPVYEDWNAVRASGRLFSYFHVLGDSSSAVSTWHSIPILPGNFNPFLFQEGGGDLLVYDFTQTTSATSPVYHIAGFEGFPKVVSDVWFGGEMPTTADTDSKVEVSIAEQLATSLSFTNARKFTFNETDRWDDLWNRRGLNNTSSFDRLQFKIELTGADGSDDKYKSINGLPIRIGFYIYTDRKVRPPSEVDPERFK